MGDLFAYPAALWLLLLAMPIVWAYRRPRRAPVVVVAVIAWWDRVLAEDARENRRLAVRDPASLAVALASLGLIVVVAAGPRVDGPIREILTLAAVTLLAVEAVAFYRRWTH